MFYISISHKSSKTDFYTLSTLAVCWHIILFQYIIFTAVSGIAKIDVVFFSQFDTYHYIYFYFLIKRTTDVKC